MGRNIGLVTISELLEVKLGLQPEAEKEGRLDLILIIHVET